MKRKIKTAWILLVLIVLAGTFLLLRYSSANSGCPTDLNGDRVTDSLDLKIFNEAYGKNVSESELILKADLNGNKIVNSEDLSIMIGSMNTPCK